MFCPECTAPSEEVVETRPWRGIYLRRRRRCARGHLFTTYEVTADQLQPLAPVPSVTDRRLNQQHLRALEREGHYARLRDAVIKASPRVSVATLAERLHCSPSFVRKCRRDAFPQKIRNDPRTPDRHRPGR